jgi:hypothetical protein
MHADAEQKWAACRDMSYNTLTEALPVNISSQMITL